MKNYFFNLEEILELDTKALNVWLSEIDGIKLSELKVQDLVFHDGKPILSGNGVYVFKKGERAVYVGNCVARNFVERIPAHFDIRPNGWFNSLLVNLIRQKKNRVKTNKADKTAENLQLAAEDALRDLELVIVNFPRYDRAEINKLEDFFKIALKPLNGFKQKSLPEAEIKIKEYIRHIVE